MTLPIIISQKLYTILSFFFEDNYATDSFSKWQNEQRDKIKHENEFLGIRHKRFAPFTGYKVFNIFKSANYPNFDPVLGFENWNDVPIMNDDETDGFFRREMDEYILIIRELEVEYSVINGSREYYGVRVERFIDSCNKACHYALMYKTYHQVVTVFRRFGTNSPMYTPYDIPQFFPFVKLVMLHEKRKEYRKAISVCDTAIAMGLFEDGTKGKLLGRQARLITKLEKSQTAK